MTGQDLKELRKKNGLTQKKIAEILKVSLTSIKQWEINHCPITATMENYIKIVLREIPLPDLGK